MQEKGVLEIATIGGGCFWCTEAVFSDLKGIEKVESGYSGGNVENPSYDDVCTGTTGHAEVIQVTFDPKVISFHDILEVFFSVHDPTTMNRQGADVGTQYRSIIFYNNEAQKNVAEKVISEMSKDYSGPIVTQVVPFKAFYKAEEYHQEYFTNNPYQPYCQAVVAPKVSKFRKHYQDRLKAL
ncbi:MAG: peptide-methionine (S)-S-oxide reductase MsrA [Nitrososphaerales archaeon]